MASGASHLPFTAEKEGPKDMGCNQCNCPDCVQERAVDRMRAPYFYEEIRPSWRDAALANEEQARVWGVLVEQTLNTYRCGVNLPAMIAIVCREVNVRPENYTRVSQQVERFIRESPKFELRKGKNGGVFLKQEAYAEPTPRGFASAAMLVDTMAKPKLASDNYTCKAPGCLNSKLNDKTDKSCWKCGRAVGT